VARKPLLSVSDVVSPAWCEYAYQYNVLSQAHLALWQRPSSITTPEGNTLVPSYVALQQREQTLRSGAKLHDQLERALQPVRVEFRVQTPEEDWALLFLRLASGLHMLFTEGRTRELPVFGLVNGRPVRGVVDEVRCSEADRQSLVLSDTKTRYAPRLPSDADQLQARLQCMLYKRLLDGLWMGALGAPPSSMADPFATPVRLEALCVELQLDTQAPVSHAFADDLAEFLAGSGIPGMRGLVRAGPPTLAAIAGCVQRSVEAMLQARRTPTLARTLELVYARRPRDSGDGEQVIGTVCFDADPRLLQAYIERVFRLLSGARAPEGVSESVAYRCRNCAWRDDCEWREQRGREALEKARAARIARIASQDADDEHLWAQFDERLLTALSW